MQERSQAERRAATSPAAGFDECRPGVIQPVFSILADMTLNCNKLKFAVRDLFSKFD